MGGFTGPAKKRLSIAFSTDGIDVLPDRSMFHVSGTNCTVDLVDDPVGNTTHMEISVTAGDIMRLLPPGYTIINVVWETTGKYGFVPCDGGVVSRAEFNELFDAIGTKFGVGDGSTTFNLPTIEHGFIKT